MPIIKDGKVVDINEFPKAEEKPDAEALLKQLERSTDKLEKTILNLGGELVEPEAIQDIEIKYNPSVARAVRRNGQLTRIHPFKLKINNEEVQLNDRIIDLINTLIIEI